VQTDLVIAIVFLKSAYISQTSYNCYNYAILYNLEAMTAWHELIVSRCIPMAISNTSSWHQK